MCKNCSILKAAFQSASDDSMNYSPILEMVKVMGMQKRLELYAGDCLLDEIHDILDKEEHYTIKHYMKCTECGQIYFFGTCIRGAPIYKTVTDIGRENLSNMLWGRQGTLYEA